MRILMILHPLEEFRNIVNAATIADALIARGNDVWLVSDALHTVTRATHVQLQRGRRSFWRTLAYIRFLIRLIRAHHIQVVHAYSGEADWATRIAARIARAALIRTTAGVGRADLEEQVVSAFSERSVVDGKNERPADTIGNRLEQLYRSAFVKFSGREIPILCYHRLVESDAECGKFDTHIRAELFEQHLRYLRDHSYRTLHFADFNSATVFENAQRAVILTFDDGYEDNYRILFPLLKKYEAKAVIYLVSGPETNEWDVVNGEQPLRLTSQSQRREMLASGLVEFGAHTVSHPDLTQICPARAVEEIHQSKIELEADLGVPVDTFAYPYGRLNHDLRSTVRQAGFRYAIATHSGPVALHEDPFQVRRIVVFPNTTINRFSRKVSGKYARISASR